MTILSKRFAGLIRALFMVGLVAVPSFSQENVEPLLKTQWWQHGDYAKYVPIGEDNDRIGCWSTALAQIMAFHGLSPIGQAAYTSKAKQLAISENFSDSHFDISQFPAKLTKKTEAGIRDEVARYCYFAAVILQKDFGTTRYQLSGQDRIQSINSHFPVEAQAWPAKNGFDRVNAWDKITAELKIGNPVLYYTESRDKKNFHAMVVDGFRQSNGEKEIHINFGWNGAGDGWYDFFKAIITPSSKFYFDNLEYFYLITFHLR